MKPATPTVKIPQPTKTTTPLLQYSGPNGYTTPNTASLSNKSRLVQPTGSSKLAHLTRQNSGIKSTSIKPATPQDRTREADEKKKKNDEKMRQVLQQREALQREKIEKHRKLMMVIFLFYKI